MVLTPAEKLNFIRSELYHELRCLLGAATVWRAFRESNAGFDVVVAMDSAFVHARCLFNFFTLRKSGNDISVTEFGPANPYFSSVYKEWEEPLNRHVLHIAKGRMNPTNLGASSHLNEQVATFAREILRLWAELERDPAASIFSADVADARARAMQDATNDAGIRTSPLFS